MKEATREGASTPAEKVDGQDKAPEDSSLQPDLRRFNQIEEMAERLKQSREQEIQERLETDPGFKAHTQDLERESTRERDLAAEGLDSAEAIPGEPPAAKAAVEHEEEEEKQEDDGQDPLSQYIVVEEDTPYFSAKVDGKRVLIPLDRAQAQLQKHEAAERRLQQAAQLSKALEERERALRENEQLLRQRLQASNPLSPSQDVDDKDLQVQARELVETLFSGTEDEAAEKLAKVLARNRASQSATPIDPRELAREAAQEARKQIKQEQVEQDSKEGYQQFSEKFPDVLSDPYLFQVADGMTDEIAAEHPDWLPSKVMLEAGKRTREWWGKTGKAESKDPLTREADLSDRHSRKAKLVTMPRPATARPPKVPEERPQTPQDIIREMRQARNQPV